MRIYQKFVSGNLMVTTTDSVFVAPSAGLLFRNLISSLCIFIENIACPEFYHCQNSSECKYLSEVCNGYKDCPQGDDEKECGKSMFHLLRALIDLRATEPQGAPH